MRYPIRTLSSYVANQIAAGEVIERPASIVNELVANSLDAHATQISISIVAGGIESIKIQDNGIGILKEELNLSLQRHTTSKIRSIEDIENIHSLGFRGEALASISAVARVEICSRTQQGEHGWQIISTPGQSNSIVPTPSAHPVGSTVEILELFHKMPARRRFLRKASTEFAYIHTLVKCLSLNYHTVAFDLYHNGRLKWKCLPNEIRSQRIMNLFGKQFRELAIAVESKHNDNNLYVTGWMSPLNIAHTKTSVQYFYVNGRLIKDKIFSQAIKQAYQDISYQNRQPTVVLFLEMDPANFDVNVHPTKAEVRFHRPGVIYDFIYKAVEVALSRNKMPSIANSIVYPNTVQHTAHLPLSNQRLAAEHAHHHIIESSSSNELMEAAKQTPFISHDIVKSHSNSAKQLTLEHIPQLPSLGYALAQLRQTYILAENQAGLIIVDAHAAHERILYEKLKTEFQDKKLHAQTLLTPITFSITPEEHAALKTHGALFRSLSFQYDDATPETLILYAAPHLLSFNALTDLIPALLSDLKVQENSYRIEEHINRLLGTIACRQAIHANCKLSLSEMNHLLQLMENTERSSYCNHGRPTWHLITFEQLDNLFCRGR